MTTEQTALATREWTDAQLQTRMKANINARFGLQDASPAALNIIFLLAKRWGLDPVNEITLYEGRPFITLDGRLQLMRRNRDYRGYRTRALSATEKVDWGYEADDLAVECTVLTKEHGEITARGCVRRAEIDGARGRAKDSGKRAAPVGIYAPEIAEKRAIARASRAAFGQDVPDEDEAGYVIEEQRNPERVALGAARFDEIFGGEDDRDTAADPPKPPDRQGSVADNPMIKSVKNKEYQDYQSLCEEAQVLEVEYEALAVPVLESLLRDCHDDLAARVQAAKEAADQPATAF